jgi:hypothetical protein
MLPARQDLKRSHLTLSTNPVHQSVLALDPARPPACKVLPQRLRPPRAGERVSSAFLDQDINPLQNLGVRLLPAEIFGPTLQIETTFKAE